METFHVGGYAAPLTAPKPTAFYSSRFSSVPAPRPTVDIPALYLNYFSAAWVSLTLTIVPARKPYNCVRSTTTPPATSFKDVRYSSLFLFLPAPDSDFRPS